MAESIKYTFAQMHSTPEWHEVTLAEAAASGGKYSVRNRLIPFSSPITFTVEYQATTAVKGATGYDWLDEGSLRINYTTPRFVVHARFSSDRASWESEYVFEFEGTRAEFTFTPKDFFDDCMEYLKNHSKLSYRDAYEYYTESAKNYERAINSFSFQISGVGLVGVDFPNSASLGELAGSSPEVISVYNDYFLPPERTAWVDNGGTVGETGSANITQYRMITLSTTFAPTDIQLSQSSAAPGQTVWLSWSGAQPGESNDIVGYEVYRSTTADGGYTLLTTISSTETEGTVAVTAPSAKGAAYYYKVVTLGSAEGYNSIKSSVYATLLCDYSVCQAPTKVFIDGSTNVEPGAPITVRWEGASAGENNTISGYSVCYSDVVDGAPQGLVLGMAKLDNGTFDTFGSVDDFFTAPTENGKTYYFRVMTSGTLEGTHSDWSEAYAAVTCTYSSPSSPTKVTLDGAKSVYVAPGSTVLIEWSGATNGANNTITGFDILRDGEVYFSDLPSVSYQEEVPAHDTAGNAYQYAVVAKGQYADSAPSVAATVYSYTDPTPPTNVEVSASESYVGGRVQLSWSGAEAGGYNDIVGYKVYVSDTVNGAQTLVATVSSDASSASCYVDAPSTAGGTSYFRVVTVGSYTDSLSSEYVTVTASGGAGVDSEVTVIVKPKVVSKRRMVFGDYDTARDGQWTLTGWGFAEPEVQTSYVEIPWHSVGGLDMSTVLTNGDPRYNRRTLTATFECSEGTREDRNRIISAMVNKLHGQRLDIVLPDDPARYVTGRVSVAAVYSDMAHASVEITANCEPWRYKKVETNIELLVAENPRTDVLCNSGRKVLVPELTVSGYNASVSLTSGDLSWTLTPGKYRLPDLVLPSGSTAITYSGSGTVVITYREAIL